MYRRLALLASAVLVCAAPARAGIPCLVDPNGVPLRWQTLPVVYNLAPGSAANRAKPLVEAGAQVWTDVPTSAAGFAAGAPMPVVLDAENWLDWFGRCGDGWSPIIIDTTGEIIDDAAGAGASDFILGFAFHDCDLAAAPDIPESSVVINGKFFGLSGASAEANVTAIVAHELGHVLNLCHVRLNGDFVDDGDPSNDAFVPIMFPAASSDVLLPDPRPRFDDRAMLSLLYPEPGDAPAGTLAGHVVSGAGATAISGAPVVVRRVSDPLTTAQWTSTGWLKLEGPSDFASPEGNVIPAIDGSWQASGLPPGGYTVEVQAGVVAGAGEFYSGAAESSDAVADPPDLASVIELGTGEARTDVTVLLPVRVRSALGETDWDVTWRARIVTGGRSRRLPADTIAPGRLELLSTGSYVVTPLAELGGSWRARGKRGVRQNLSPEPMQALLDVTGSSLRVLKVKGRGSADRSMTRIHGKIVVRGRVLTPPRSPFVLHFSYHGTRVPGVHVPGRVPLLPSP